MLNTVSVPMGEQIGTDAAVDSEDDGKLAGHRSLWAVVRDHANATLYWRTEGNPSLRRARLADFDVSPGAKRRVIPLDLEGGDFFIDAAGESDRA